MPSRPVQHKNGELKSITKSESNRLAYRYAEFLANILCLSE
jgi:hypothetical protein